MRRDIEIMPLASILALGLDNPPMTPQQIAEQALLADQEARRLERIGDNRARAARAEANAIADIFARRAQRKAWQRPNVRKLEAGSSEPTGAAIDPRGQ